MLLRTICPSHAMGRVEHAEHAAGDMSILDEHE
jgi:hypothetical protein